MKTLAYMKIKFFIARKCSRKYTKEELKQAWNNYKSYQKLKYFELVSVIACNKQEFQKVFGQQYWN